MSAKGEAYLKIKNLVERFEDQYASYKSTDYNETQTRRDFIDPFFKALGWDVDNEEGVAESYREVIHEDRIKIQGRVKAPDYAFRMHGGKRLFFVEAKKPSIVVKDDIQPAYQVRRYGWNDKLAISIVTDFEEFAVYDCTRKPKNTDKASIARIEYLTFRDYLPRFEFIWETFSRERILKGGLDKYVKSDRIKRGTATVDKEFLHSLDSWRKDLATSISFNNKSLDEDEINFAVQQTLDRIIFLRIAEDRGIEPYANLKAAKNYQQLYDIFKSADNKYNSGLFDFEKDKISATLKIDNKIIKNVIEELYYPISPYEFSILSVEILGSAYEQFLGKLIKVDSAHRATIEEKPEVRKAGGVYYTPQYIVEYIVANTIGPLIKDKKPEEVAKLKILDPACGSGSFLLGAYEYLLGWHRDYYLKNHKASKGKKEDKLTPQGTLSTSEKKRILLNNIYGVDLDTNAVEVTKLSLLLKCMEGETEASIKNQFKMFHERVLPTLDSNIKSGNSLIDTDYYDAQLDFGGDRKVKPFNWQRAFPDVFKISKPEKPDVRSRLKRAAAASAEATEALDQAMQDYLNTIEEPAEGYGNIGGGFDVVIGNPPYVRQELLGEQKVYFQNHYQVYHGMADLYSYFIERSIKLLKPGGIYGVIVANKWMRANYGEPLRVWLKKQSIFEIIDFGDLPVFETATTYPCILIAGKEDKGNKNFKLTLAKTLQFRSLAEYVEHNRSIVSKNSLEDSGWNLADEAEQKLLKKIQAAGIPLGEYVKGKIYRGVLTGLNEAFVIDKATRDRLVKEDKRSAEIIKPFLAGRDIKRYQQPESDKFLILFPKGFTNQSGNNPKEPWKWLMNSYPALAKYLAPFEDKGQKRYDKGDFWWELRACDYYAEFEKEKIIWPGISSEIASFAFDSERYYGNDNNQLIVTEDKFLLGLLNSKVAKFQLRNICDKVQGGFYRLKIIYIKQISCIVPKSLEQTGLRDQIAKRVDQILQITKEITKSSLASNKERLLQRMEHLENEIDAFIFELYKISSEEIKLLETKDE